MLFGFALSTHHLPARIRAAIASDLAGQAAAHEAPYHFVAAAIIATGIIVAVVYCLGSLHAERRDRTILFWRSLPVSDLTTVLSKASVPLIVTPVVSFAIILAVQLVMLLVSSAVLLSSGMDVGALWAQLRLGQGWLVLAYSLIVLVLWHAPLYGWFLLISSWAKRSPFLWAFLPPLGICVVEKIAFNASHFGELLGYRIGGFQGAYVQGAFLKTNQGAFALHPLSVLAPIKYLSTPGLWYGLIAAASFVAAAVWLRRRRELL